MKTILLVDDNADVRNALKALVAAFLHHDVVCMEKENADAAIALLRTGLNFDYVLTDLDMPAGEGLSVIAVARARLPRAKVALISGSLDEKTIRLARIAGVDATFPKPIMGGEFERLRMFLQT